MRHLGVPSSFMTGRPSLTVSAVKAVYQNICWATLPCAGIGPASPKVMPAASGGVYFSSHSIALVTAYTAAASLVAPPRVVQEPTGWDCSLTRMPHSSTGRPFGSPLSPIPAIDIHASV